MPAAVPTPIPICVSFPPLVDKGTISCLILLHYRCIVLIMTDDGSQLVNLCCWLGHPRHRAKRNGSKLGPQATGSDSPRYVRRPGAIAHAGVRPLPTRFLVRHALDVTWTSL